MAISNLPLLFFIISTITIILSPSSTSATQSTEFIKTNCNYTSYPSLCFTSLSKYACYVKQSPLQLAQFATKVSLSNVKSAASVTSSLYQKALNSTSNKTSNKTVKALKDCVELLRDAADNTRYSLSQLGKINATAPGSPGSLWTLSNVQTYMSATLTKEDTCTDGLKEMGAVVKDVSAWVVKAKKYTSNALGLVNRLTYSYR